MAWLRSRPAARGRPTAMMGSRGSELALLCASLDPSLARTVIALTPGAYVYPAEDGDVDWTRNGRALTEGFAIPIPVERIRGRVLVAGAGADAIWRSDDFAGTVAATITERGRARVERLVYPDAGHGIGLPLPFLPNAGSDRLGGTPRADQAAREDLWPRIVRLLDGG